METSQTGENFRSLLNTNTSLNSEITAETSRAIISEISSQMSKKFEEVSIDVNAQVLEAIISVIEEKALPTIQNALIDIAQFFFEKGRLCHGNR